MNTREKKELNTKSTPDLETLLKEKRDRLHALRFDLAAGKVKNVGEIRAVRKDIARILTVVSTRHDK